MTDKEKREIQCMVDKGNILVVESIETKFDNKIGEFMRMANKRFEALEQPKKEGDKLLSTADAMSFFQVSRSTINKYVKECGLIQQKTPGEKRGKAYYKLSDLNKFLKTKG